jgi:hypothetical protein
MDDDDPWALQMLLRFLYTFSTEFIDDVVQDVKSMSKDKKRQWIRGFIMTAILADKYHQPILLKKITAIIKREVCLGTCTKPALKTDARALLRDARFLWDARGSSALNALRDDILDKLVTYPVDWSKLSEWESEGGKKAQYVQGVDDLLIGQPTLARDLLEAMAKRVLKLSLTESESHGASSR